MIAKMMAYEVLWCLVDGSDRVRLQALDRAKRDLKAVSCPDLNIAALETLHRQPPYAVLPLLCSAGMDKTLCGLLGADAAPAVRGCAAPVLAALAFDAWILADACVVTSAPLASFAELIRRRQDVQDKVHCCGVCGVSCLVFCVCPCLRCVMDMLCIMSPPPFPPCRW